MPAVPLGLDPAEVRRLVVAALAEDIGSGDITTEATVTSSDRATGRLLAKQDLVVCGLDVARAVFDQLAPDLAWRPSLGDGDEAREGAQLAAISGAARAILSAERVALNLLQHLSGIATLTRQAVREVEGTGAVILDTRKTTPTLRSLEKYAVRCGGGTNHRIGLFDAVLIKDNHIALAGGVTEALRRAHGAGLDPQAIEIEVTGLDEAREALAAGARRLLLDNVTPEIVAAAKREFGARATIEVSGGLHPGRLRAFAEAGADYLSIGRLTHSAPAADIALDLQPGA